MLDFLVCLDPLMDLLVDPLVDQYILALGLFVVNIVVLLVVEGVVGRMQFT